MNWVFMEGRRQDRPKLIWNLKHDGLDLMDRELTIKSHRETRLSIMDWMDKRLFQRPCRRIIKVVVVVSDKALRLRTAETTIFIHSMSNELPNFENRRHLCDNNKKSKMHKTPFRPWKRMPEDPPLVDLFERGGWQQLNQCRWDPSNVKSDLRDK